MVQIQLKSSAAAPVRTQKPKTRLYKHVRSWCSIKAICCRKIYVQMNVNCVHVPHHRLRNEKNSFRKNCCAAISVAAFHVGLPINPDDGKAFAIRKSNATHSVHAFRCNCANTFASEPDAPEPHQSLVAFCVDFLYSKRLLCPPSPHCIRCSSYPTSGCMQNASAPVRLWRFRQLRAFCHRCNGVCRLQNALIVLIYDFQSWTYLC